MKILALDLGDVHTGTAITDALAMFARPYETTPTEKLVPFLTDLFKKEKISVVVIGHPRTLRGTKSEQTLKIEKQKEELESLFPDKKWVFVDERLTSKSAEQHKKGNTKEDKIRSHSIAAAVILSTYLESLAYQ